MDNPFLYEVNIENNGVLGVLLTLDSRGVLAKKIQAHEQIDSIKTNHFHNEFSNKIPQSSPIILGVFSPTYDSVLNDFKINTTSVDITQNEKVWLIKNECKPNLLNLLHAEPELFLVDGHHRLHALQTLNKPIVAWVVSIDKLSIKSFIKVYRCRNIDQFMSKVNKKFTLCERPNFNRNTQDKQIHLYSNGSVYQLHLDPNDSFVEHLCHFHTIITQENLELHTHAEYHPQQLEHLIQRYKTDHMITTHTALDHGEILHHQLLPIHTTCFHPKPAENNLVLFKLMGYR